MNIGLTYDLRSDWLAAGYTLEQTAEFDSPRTIEAIEAALRELGHTPVRIGRFAELVSRVAAGERWDLVFNIAEGMFGPARESQVPALLDAYEIPCTFSDAMVLALALDKAVCKRIVRDMGLPTPQFAVVRSREEARSVALPMPLFAKPVAEGTSKGIAPSSRVTSKEALVERCGALLEQFRQPVLVEEFLPGREVTVGIVGTGERARAIGTMEVRIKPGVEDGIYSQDLKEDWHGRLEYVLADDAAAREAETLALGVYRGLGCRDAGRVDLRQDARGRFSFMEINPLAGMHPEHSDLPILCGLRGVSYVELIREIVDSARERARAQRAAAPARSATPR